MMPRRLLTARAALLFVPRGIVVFDDRPRNAVTRISSLERRNQTRLIHVSGRFWSPPAVNVETS